MSLYELFFGFTGETKALHPECFQTPDHNHLQHGRTLPMEVLSLGMSRTGTASMQAALEILGYPCYHGFNMYSDIDNAEMFWEGYKIKYLSNPPGASSASPSDEKQNTGKQDPATADEFDWKHFFDKTLGNFSAVTDVPPASFASELMAAYPKAKVILVERDIEAWYASFERIFIQPSESPVYACIAWLDQAYSAKLWRILTQGVGRCQFGSKDGKEWRANAREVYKRHYAEIRRLAQQGPPGRLLEYRLGSGWEPLCRFLGRPLPDVPFPRVNEAEMMEAKTRVIFVRGVRNALARLRPTLGVLGVIAVVSIAMVINGLPDHGHA